MLLTIDLKGKTISALAGLLDVEAKQIQTKEMYFGKAHAWALRPAPDRLEMRCILDIHPLDSIPVDVPYTTSGGIMNQYINPRAHIAQTSLSHAILALYQQILDKANDFPWLGKALDITCTLPPLLGSEEVFQELFGKIGYQCEVEKLNAPQLFQLTLKGNFSLPRILWDLIMVVPALDIHRYYWTPPDQMNKILERLPEYGPQHPNPAFLEKAYRINHQRLFDKRVKAITRNSDPGMDHEDQDQTAFALENSAWDTSQISSKIHGSLQDLGVKTPAVFNIGNSQLLMEMLPNEQFESILALDPVMVRLQNAGQILGGMDIPAERKSAIQLLIGTPTFRDKRVEHRDAIVIPNGFCKLSPNGLQALQENIFHHSKPTAVLIIVPNSEYNSLIEGIPAGEMRHPGHQFEWNRKQTAKWAKKMGEQYGYNSHTIPVGTEDPSLGPPAQLILFHHLSQL